MERVQLPPGLQINIRVEESGLSRFPWKEEHAGSNPASYTRNGLLGDGLSFQTVTLEERVRVPYRPLASM
jgi:hypothetical protein